MVFTEQRSSNRIPVRMRVDCKPLSSAEIKDILDGHGYSELAYASLALSRPRQGMLPARIKNLSPGGLCLEGPLPMKEGEVAALDLHLLDERVALKALAEVVWSQPAADETRPHSCGLRFAAMDEDGLKRLKSYLALLPRDREAVPA